VEWSGVEWSGVEWSGVDWIGVEWIGVEWTGVDCIGAPTLLLLRYCYMCTKLCEGPFKYVTLLSSLVKETRESHPESGVVDAVLALITVVHNQCWDFLFSHRSAYKMEYLSTHLKNKERREWAVRYDPKGWLHYPCSLLLFLILMKY
jgi:hypothetical protein